MTEDTTTRWTVTVSKETDLALRAFLSSQGMRKGDLSKFIEDAVRWRMFDQNVQAIKARNADLPADELQEAIDEACAAVRAEMWPTQPRPTWRAMRVVLDTNVLIAALISQNTPPDRDYQA